MHPQFYGGRNPVVLGIESSCDETAAAVVRGRTVLSRRNRFVGGRAVPLRRRSAGDRLPRPYRGGFRRGGARREKGGHRIRRSGRRRRHLRRGAFGRAARRGVLCQGVRLCAEQTPHRGGPYPRASRRRLYQRARSGAALRHPARQRRAHGRPVRRVGGEIQDTRRNAGRRGGRGVRQGGAGFGPEIPGRAQHRAVHPRGERETRHSHAENAEGGRRL